MTRLHVTAEGPAIYSAVFRVLFDTLDELEEDVRFGPLDMSRLLSEGLTVSGSVGVLAEKVRSIEGVQVRTW